MNKAELIDVLTEKLGTDRRTATEAVEHVVDTIVLQAEHVNVAEAVSARPCDHAAAWFVRGHLEGTFPRRDRSNVIAER